MSGDGVFGLNGVDPEAAKPTRLDQRKTSTLKRLHPLRESGPCPFPLAQPLA